MGGSTSSDGAQPFMSLDDYLSTLLPSSEHAELRRSVLPTLVHALSEIASSLRRSQRVSLAGSANAFGDDQLNVDVVAEAIIRGALAKCPAVVTASSEEDPVERSTSSSSQATQDGVSVSAEQYTVAFDPLDGSSIIAPNWAVGTIIGIWAGRTALHQPPAKKQIASVLGVFGPRTIAIVAVRIPGTTSGVCFEVGVSAQENFEILRPSIKFATPPFRTRYFAPANLRAAAEDEAYAALVAHFIQQRYTLRYSGGLVPDVVHALVKGHGVYVSPVPRTNSSSPAKLRRLFELLPLALVVECAGGRAVDPGDGSDVLARGVEDINERAGLVCGVTEDVEFVIKALCGGEK